MWMDVNGFVWVRCCAESMKGHKNNTHRGKNDRYKIQDLIWSHGRGNFPKHHALQIKAKWDMHVFRWVHIRLYGRSGVCLHGEQENKGKWGQNRCPQTCFATVIEGEKMQTGNQSNVTCGNKHNTCRQQVKRSIIFLLYETKRKQIDSTNRLFKRGKTSTGNLATCQKEINITQCGTIKYERMNMTHANNKSTLSS